MATKITEYLFSTPAKGNYLTLYFIPSPNGVDWTSPRSVLFSQVKNHFSPLSRKLGHVNVHLKCEDGTEILTGMSSDKMDTKRRLIIHGAGFGILWHSFEGVLEERKELLSELPELAKDNRLSFVRVKISESNCAKLKKYVEDYKSENMQRQYGLANRPRYGEGGGCSAFGASFLEVANILQEESKPWQVDLLVPESLLGNPVQNKYVPLWKVLSTDKWASENEPHKKIHFWDPDRMHNWVLKLYNSENQDKTLNHYQKIKLADAPGLFLDYSDVNADDSPIWLSDTK